MSLTFTGASGGFGKMGPFGKAFNALAAESWEDDEDRQIVYNAVRDAARQYFINYVSADAGRQLRLDAAMEEFIRQMYQGAGGTGDYVTAPTVSAGSASFAGTGTGKMYAGVVRPNAAWFEDSVNHCVRAETIEAMCVQDLQPTGVSGGEVFSVRGGAILPPWHASWPGGSGANLQVRATSSTTDGATFQPGMNMLVNSDFESVTANVPDQWALGGGTVAGTHLQSLATAYRGSTAMKFIGDAGGSATTSSITQSFGTPSTGTPVPLLPGQAYLVGLAVRRYGTGAVTGTLEFGLNQAKNLYGSSARNRIAIDCATLTTSYVMYGGIIVASGAARTLPEKFIIGLTSGLGNTHEVYFDSAVCAPAYPLSPSGPWVGILAGDTPFVVKDRFQVAIANDYAGAQAKAWDRLFGLYEMGRALPTVGGGSAVADTIAVNTP